MDVLSDILGALRLRGTLYFTTDFRRPWGVRVPAFKRVARFHLIIRGMCWVRVDALAEPVLLEPGDMIMIPHGAEHVLSDTPDTPCRRVDEILRDSGFTGEGALVIGGDDTGAATRMVCGHFEFDDTVEHALLAQLPSALVIRWADAVRDSPLQDAFQFIAREVQDARPGHDVVVRRMSEVLFVQAVRFWANQSAAERGVLAALADTRLAQALAAIHARPAEHWTLESLGRAASMGRTAFAERFRAVVGETPLQYLTSWRMQKAKALLAETHWPIDQIATQVGYDSAASLSRVFRKAVGTSPGAFRRARAALPAG